MIGFPNAKINLGLHVVRKRDDGYHDIETVMYPIGWCDALEFVEAEDTVFTFSGLAIPGNPADNLLSRALVLLGEAVPPLHVHLHKHIPMGAGLGGGSSDAAHFLSMLNERFNLRLGDELYAIATQLGSDCPFFLRNMPVLATGRGTEFSALNLSLRQYYLLVVYPGVHSNTGDAYASLVPRMPATGLTSVVQSMPVKAWRDHLVNDFELTVFARYPQIAELKEELYRRGALYASMSGSGSAVFGIFDHEPACDFTDSRWMWHLEKPADAL